MLCGGTRETREPYVTIGQTVSKSETTKNLPTLQDFNGKKITFKERPLSREKYRPGSNVMHCRSRAVPKAYDLGF